MARLSDTEALARHRLHPACAKTAGGYYNANTNDAGVTPDETVSKNYSGRYRKVTGPGQEGLAHAVSVADEC
jgi:hypothetical protein